MLPSKDFVSCFVVLFFTFTRCLGATSEPKFMSVEERAELREEARDMFYHAYRAYMDNAYPADELMPLSCSGRFRGLTPNRGDIDDALGNFSLTLIDTLDTLVVMGDVEEFETAVKMIIDHVTFDNDVIVSVFETNIRILGGLLSSHILAEYLQQRDGILPWYRGELLDMAKDVGYRLLPAFNTTTGIPHARVNLKYGIKSDRLESAKETCTACAGSVILEMAALSRLTGEPVFEEKAHRAMDELWKMRHRSSDLMGTVLNVHSGDWVRRDSGVGAGIDSYYEYCLKAYILLGDEKYLDRFNRHYNAVMKYISQGPMLLDVHMHRPHTNSRNYMDALLAFWPGLQVLKGDIKPAVETHEMLYQVMQRHKFIPEAFTIDFQVHWGNHPLRPEFLESTYFLYTATKDPYYLEVGKNVLKSLQRYARVACGYAAVNDVRTGKQEDRMDSFVLAETFKYLYLLFTEEEDLFLNLNEFIFTTEGHLLPLRLADVTNATESSFESDYEDNEFARSCPNTFKLFPETVRKSLQNMVDGTCPNKTRKRRLTASEFSASNINHLKIVKDMGINIVALNDGRVQLLHTFASARSMSDAEEGLQFMQEMVELSKLQTEQPEVAPQAVTFVDSDNNGNNFPLTLLAGPSHFGANFDENVSVTARTIIAHPIRGCVDLKMGNYVKGKIAIMERGDCMFVEKARRVQKLGAVGAIIVDNVHGSSSEKSPMFSMSGDGTDDVTIPTVFLYQKDANKLISALILKPSLEVTISKYKSDIAIRNEEESMFQKLKVSVQEFLNKHTGITFTKKVQMGNFLADVSADKIRITFEKSDQATVPIEKITNQQWSQIRKGLLQSILQSDSRDLYVPLNILQIYYQTLSNANAEELKAKDIVKQTEWLLTELAIEYHRDDGDSLVKFEVDTDSAVLRQVKDITEKEVLTNVKKLEKLTSSILETIDQIEKNVMDDLSKTSKDSLVIADDKETNDKVIITQEQLEASENKSGKSAKQRVSDEL